MLFPIVILVAIAARTSACINTPIVELKSGIWLYHETDGNVPQGHEFFFKEDKFASDLETLDSLFTATKNPDYLAEKGVLMIILGEYTKAIDLYLGIEAQFPGQYTTASNIGTAYELAGNNPEALKWIKRAIEIDSTSHFGSEWIHVQILEAKIKGSEYVNANHLIRTDFGNEPYPETSLTAIELLQLEKSLFYQLDERMSFVRDPEPIVARLLFELGNVAFLRKNFDDSRQDYEFAARYGFNHELLSTRRQELQSVVNGTVSNSYRRDRNIMVFAGIGLIIGVIGFSAWRLRY